MRVGEFTQPDSISRRSPTKLTLCHTCCLMLSNYSFTLLYHKGDRFFDSNTILVEQQPSTRTCPHTAFTKYIFARDTHFPLHLELWLTAAGNVLTYSWVVSCLKTSLGSDVGGHSIRSGGATALAVAGVPDHIIQLISRWSSDTFHIYIRLHPVLLQVLLHGWSPHTT